MYTKDVLFSLLLSVYMYMYVYWISHHIQLPAFQLHKVYDHILEYNVAFLKKNLVKENTMFGKLFQKQITIILCLFKRRTIYHI